MAEEDRDRPAGAGGDDPAAGTVANPIAPDEAQPGDRSELGANLGGPVDVFPGGHRRGVRRGGVDHPTPGLAPRSDRAGPEKGEG
jgi:hypothetical protein